MTFTKYIERCGQSGAWQSGMTVALASSVDYPISWLYWLEFTKLNNN